IGQGNATSCRLRSERHGLWLGHEDRCVSPSANPTFASIVAVRLSRRRLLPGRPRHRSPRASFPLDCRAGRDPAARLHRANFAKVLTKSKAAGGSSLKLRGPKLIGNLRKEMVGRDGIEPPTPGFSGLAGDANNGSPTS